MKKLGLFIFLLPILLVGCNSNNDVGANSNSTLREVGVYLTDAPFDQAQNLFGMNPMLRFSAVNLDIVGVQYQVLDTTKHEENNDFKGIFENNHWHAFRPEMNNDTTTWKDMNFTEKIIPVSMLSNGDSTLLANLTIPANTHIAKLKFKLGKNSTVVLADSAKTVKPLNISDKSDSTLVVHIFNKPPKGRYNVMVDFDIARSIVVDRKGNCYLIPTMRCFIMESTGQVVGSVLPKNVKTKVFVVTNNDTISTVSNVKMNNLFKLKGLEAGTYNVQFMPLDTIGKVTVSKSVTIKNHGTVVLDKVKVIP